MKRRKEAALRSAIMRQVNALLAAAAQPPALEPPAEALVFICAWCPGFDPKDPRNAHATHGMCPACAAKFAEEGF